MFLASFVLRRVCAALCLLLLVCGFPCVFRYFRLWICVCIGIQSRARNRSLGIGWGKGGHLFVILGVPVFTFVLGLECPTIGGMFSCPSPRVVRQIVT